VDNPHTKPFAFWEWVIAEVQRSHPDVLFLAEAFTRPKKMQTLARLGFTQSYTYFTWRNSAPELREYLEELSRPVMVDFFRPNFFANTPDILHEFLQQGGPPAFRIRLLLAGTLSPLYGIYSGYELSENVPVREGSEEYLDSEKYQVRVRDWSAPGNLDGDIARLNRIRRTEPALQTLGNISFHPANHRDVLFYLKGAWGRDLLCAVSVNPREAITAELEIPLERVGLAPDAGFEVEDLLTGERRRWQGARQQVRFDPAERVGYIWRVIRNGGHAG
jgi:starch synthase (maltosyl-transferring)